MAGTLKSWEQLLPILARSFMPNEVITKIFAYAVGCGAQTPWGLCLLSPQWRVTVFRTRSLWPRDVVSALVDRLIALWNNRTRRLPEGLVGPLRAYALATVGAGPTEEDLCFAVDVLLKIERFLAWPTASRSCGTDDGPFYSSSYPALVQANFIAAAQDRILDKAFDNVPPERPGQLLSAAAAVLYAQNRRAAQHNLLLVMDQAAQVICATLRILSRSSVPSSARILSLAHRLWASGRCSCASLWLAQFDVDSDAAHIEMRVVLRMLSDACEMAHPHRECATLASAVAAEHIMRVNRADNNLIMDRLESWLAVAVHPNGAPPELSAEYFLTRSLASLLSLGRVLAYADADPARVGPFLSALLVAAGQPVEVAIHANRPLHHPIRRLACAVLVAGLSDQLGDDALDQTDPYRANKFALYVLGLASPSPCSQRADAPPWAGGYEPALAVALTVVLAPHAVCPHVAKAVASVFAHVDVHCGPSTSLQDARTFCYNGPGMGYMCEFWAWKSLEPHSRATAFARDHAPYPARLWSNRAPAWNGLVTNAIDRAVNSMPSSDGFDDEALPRRALLLSTVARARAAIRERLVGNSAGMACYFHTCQPEVFLEAVGARRRRMNCLFRHASSPS